MTIAMVAVTVVIAPILGLLRINNADILNYLIVVVSVLLAITSTVQYFKTSEKLQDKELEHRKDIKLKEYYEKELQEVVDILVHERGGGS